MSNEQKHFAIVALETADKTEDGRVYLSQEMVDWAIESIATTVANEQRLTEELSAAHHTIELNIKARGATTSEGAENE